MDRYQDLTVLPDTEIPAHFIIAKVYEKLHTLLVDKQMTQIGVSFPESKSGVGLGRVVRLHGSEEELSRLNISGNLQGLDDYVHIRSIKEVPAKVQHVSVRRVQVKSNPERIRRRYAKRHNVSMEEARASIPETSAKLSTLPFVQMASKSTHQSFRLFVEHGKPTEKPVAGEFNSYGLGNGATVPWF